MKLLKVLAQHPIYSIDKPFYYYADQDVKIGSRVEINFNNRLLVGFVIGVSDILTSIEEESKKLGFAIKKITSLVDENPILSPELFSLCELLAKRYHYPLIGVFQTVLPPHLRPNKGGVNSHQGAKYEYFYSLVDENIGDLTGLSCAQNSLIEKLKIQKSIAKRDVKNKKTIEVLFAKNIIKLDRYEKRRYEIKKTFQYENVIELNEEQKNAFEGIKNSDKMVNLLYGVTASGKTEVYIKLIEETINNGENALILVPEIGLTPLMVSRIVSYFSSDFVAVLHSSLSDGELYDEYRKIKDGKVKIIVGTRSAIFAPLSNIGLICIDEEQDDSYQQDDRFTYSAKDVAIIRAEREGAKVVLGSATPSVESMARAKSGQYGLFILTKKYHDTPSPRISLIDMTDEFAFGARSSIFSLSLIKGIKDTLNDGKEVILLINNKGYSRSISCRSCGYTFRCPTCDIPLVYHREDDTLRCHHCDYKIKKPKNCPSCNSRFFRFNGYGIERVEEDFKKLFPDESYLLLDGDRTKKSMQIADILFRFEKGESKVLIGTQIVAKGHDFSNVGLVGIMNADTLLNFPSYKSREKTFQLIAQMIGRSGRKDGSSDAMIQTYHPSDLTIVFASNGDYIGFFESEMKMRKALFYPPFSNLVDLVFSAKDSEDLRKFMYSFKSSLSVFKKVFKVIGPSDTFLRAKRYTRTLSLKAKAFSDLDSFLDNLIILASKNSKIHLEIKFNPNNFI
jgi:primosomal protein N' (replication factor Y)